MTTTHRTPTLSPCDLGTVLGVWAHPDDEAFLAAGLTARLTAAGQRVAVATATWGEHGTADPTTWPPDRLARRRAAELAASLAVTGVTEHRALGHMDGTLPDVPFGRGVAQVAAVLDAVRPDTVVTFGPDGMTGHPDHRTVSAWTERACARVGRPVRLLHATTTAAFAERWRDVNATTGAFLTDDTPVRTPAADVALEVVLDEDERDRKVVALRAQASQTTGLFDLLGEPTLRDWWGVETFVLAPAHRIATRLGRGVDRVAVGAAGARRGGMPMAGAAHPAPRG